MPLSRFSSLFQVTSMLQDIIQPFRTSAPSTRTQRHLGTFLVMGWTLALLGMVEASAQDLPANPTQRLDRNNLLLYPDADGTFKTATKSEEWLHRRKIILASMQEVMGPLPGEEKRCALELEIVEEFEADTYMRRLITYRPEPKSIIPAYLLIPKEALTTTDKKFPGVLTLHQTHPPGPQGRRRLGRPRKRSLRGRFGQAWVCLPGTSLSAPRQLPTEARRTRIPERHDESHLG